MNKLLLIKGIQDFANIKQALEGYISGLEIFIINRDSEIINNVRNYNADLIIIEHFEQNEECKILCNELKSNHFTNYIPIIILTKENLESHLKIELFESGVDLIIAQPDEIIEFAAQVKAFIKRKSEDALKSNNATLQTILSAAPVGIGLVTNRIIDWTNDQLQEMLGYKAEELNGQRARILYESEEEFERIANVKHPNVKKYGVGHIETKFVKKDGSLLNIILSSSAINPSDWSKGLIFTALDITKVKNTEALLIESEEKYKNILSNSLDGIYITQNRKIKFCNQQLAEMFGFENPDELIDKHIETLTAPESIKLVRHNNLLRETKQNISSHYEFHGLKKDGSKFDIESMCSQIMFNGEIATQGNVRDITSRKQNELVQHTIYQISNAISTTNDLAELYNFIRLELSNIIDTKNFYIALYNAENDTINLPFMIDEKDNFTSFPALKTITAYVIKNDTSLLITKEGIIDFEEKGIIEPAGTTPEIWLGVPLKSHSSVIGMIGVQNYEDKDAYNQKDLKILEFVSTQIAMSIVKKKAEQDLVIQKEKAEESDKLKSAFLANMSHEIRTPMNAIIGFSSLLVDTSITDEERAEFVELITSNGNSLLNLIDDIIDIAKIEAEKLTIDKSTCYINKTIQELLYTFEDEKNKKGKFDIELKAYFDNSDADFAIITDPYRFKQVLTNLIGNAIKFTYQGYIKIGYEIMDNNFIKFYVKDTGIGISDDKIDIIFDRFRQVEDTHTREFGGTGLGLTISNNIIKLLGGKLWVESDKNFGSTFFFTLPNVETYGKAQVRPETHTEDLKAEKKIQWDDKNILIVEDFDSNYFYLDSILSKTNANLLWAKDGFQAIDICKSNDNIDIILMDIQLPEMSGYTATQKIKEFRSDLPIIAQTAYALAGDEAKCLQAGCDNYIAKPYKVKELLSMLNRYLTKTSVSQ
ncbi:MAG: PAS domain S-box protein [Saprospiraceae bacterium]|nr:PAS domain S-box protein [Saprospiraceae bacterium]